MNRRLLAYKKQAEDDLIPTNNLLGGFAFVNIGGWTNAIVKVTRDSDNATAYVFSDPASDIGEISLSSPISTSSDTTASATLLSAWKSTDVLTIEEWYFQQLSNVIDTDRNVSEPDPNKQNELADASGLHTVNGRVTLNTTTSQTSLISDGFAGVAMSDNFTVFGLSATQGTEDLAIIFRVHHPGSSYLQSMNDNRINKRNAVLRTDSNTNFIVENLVQNNTNDLKLISTIKNATDVIGYYNGVLQQTVAHDGFDYDASRLAIGCFADSAGNYYQLIPAVFFYSNDVTADISEIHTSIKSIYGIT